MCKKSEEKRNIVLFHAVFMQKSGNNRRFFRKKAIFNA